MDYRAELVVDIDGKMKFVALLDANDFLYQFKSQSFGGRVVTLVEKDSYMADLTWLLRCLENFCPFNGDLPEGLDPSMYQTLSYQGDKALLDKFNEIKSRIIKC